MRHAEVTKYYFIIISGQKVIALSLLQKIESACELLMNICHFMKTGC